MFDRMVEFVNPTVKIEADDLLLRLPTAEYASLATVLPRHSEAGTAVHEADTIVVGLYFRIERSKSALVEILAAALENRKDTATEIMRQVRSEEAPIDAKSVASLARLMDPTRLLADKLAHVFPLD